MRRSFATLAVFALTSLVNVKAADNNATCHQIANAISSASGLYWPVDVLGHYAADIHHWASSSSHSAACSVEPGTTQDVGIILQIVGQTQTPFAVKGGGHASNPGFSSTSGVQIAMTRFNAVKYNQTKQTVDVGSGLIWDDVYEALEPFGVNVVGGRVTGVGVAGFTLGGGYSWLTNQRGLTVDNIVAYELVLPSGVITTVSPSSNPDLWFALRGGFNNFGIVTKFTLNTYPQGEVWGGLMTIIGDHIESVNAATLQFIEDVQDPKAAVLPTYNYLPIPGVTVISLLMFYDGPQPPAGIFDNFLALPALEKDLSTRSFLSLVLAAPSNATTGQRGVFQTVAVEKYDADFLTAVANETEYWGGHLALETGLFISYDIEPFLPSILSHGSNSAWPPARAKAYLPTNLYYSWLLELADDHMHDSIKQSAQQLTAVAIKGGQQITNAPLYGNYAIYDTPLASIYGPSNLPRLKAIKVKYDPRNIMGLAGGWKF